MECFTGTAMCGSRKRSTFDPARDIPDLTGKVAIVTGGNRGLGYAIIQHLAQRGAKVYLAARSKDRADAAIEQLHAEGLKPGNGQIEWLHLDLSDPRQTRRSAEEFLTREKHLDILVNNAGYARRAYVIGPDGVQDIMLANYLGVVIFTKTFLSLLTDTARDPQNDVRIAMMASSYTHLLKGRTVRFSTLDDFNEEFKGVKNHEMLRYAKTKLANILYAKALQKDFDARGVPITVMSIDPGLVDTPGVRGDRSMRSPAFGPILRLWMWWSFVPPSEGAYSTVFAVASPAVRADREKYKGAYIIPPGQVGTPTVPQGESEELAKELWEETEAVCKALVLG
ncbi:NAD-P-binding protein [Earliella scabrosa]|nr:NAD-P-binding protein [Earliella scabrosa]